MENQEPFLNMHSVLQKDRGRAKGGRGCAATAASRAHRSLPSGPSTGWWPTAPSPSAGERCCWPTLGRPWRRGPAVAATTVTTQLLQPAAYRSVLLCTSHSVHPHPRGVDLAAPAKLHLECLCDMQLAALASDRGSLGATQRATSRKRLGGQSAGGYGFEHNIIEEEEESVSGRSCTVA